MFFLCYIVTFTIITIILITAWHESKFAKKVNIKTRTDFIAVSIVSIFPLCNAIMLAAMMIFYIVKQNTWSIKWPKHLE